MNLSELKKYRKIAKMTQEEVAKACDINISYYGMIERGLRKPRHELLNKIMESINCECRILIKEE